MKYKVLFLAIIFSEFCFSQDLLNAFKNGKYQKCISDGSGKSKGLKFEFKYPDTWIEKPTDHPNVAKTVINDKSAIIQIITIIKKINKIPNKNDLKIILSKDFLVEDFIGKNASLEKFTSNLKIDGEEASSLIYTAKIQRLDKYITSKTLTYCFFWKQYQITINFGISPENTSEIDTLFNKYLPIFEQIIGSFVITSKWE